MRGEMDMSKDVYIFVEQRDSKIQKVSLELLGKGRELADKLGQRLVAVVLGMEPGTSYQKLIHDGADEVVYVEDPVLAEYMTEPYAKVLTAIIRERQPEILLFGATSVGRDLAPRVSARVHTGLTADCTSLVIDEESNHLLMTRPAFGGNIMATIACENHRPQMATVRPGVMGLPVKDETRIGVLTPMAMNFDKADQNVEILSVVRSVEKTVDIMEAGILVSGGRGVGGPEKFDTLRELASALGGEVASSRAAVDAGWMERECQVGQTGKTVRPGCYIACGILGAIQHVAGMESSDYIIAINKNESAPIFDTCDLGIVGDLHVIIPKLTQAVKKMKESQG